MLSKITTALICIIIFVSCNNYKEKIQGQWRIISINGKTVSNIDRSDLLTVDLTVFDDKMILKGPIIISFEMKGDEVVCMEGNCDGKIVFKILEVTSNRLAVNSFLNGLYFTLGQSRRIEYQRIN